MKKRKITNTTTQATNQAKNQSPQQINTMSDAIYAQHELDIDIITNLKLKNNSLKIENEDLDKKKHFLTLELSNSQCDIGELKKQISYLKDENIRLKQFITIMRKADAQFELYVKYTVCILILLLILTIYIFYL